MIVSCSLTSFEVAHTNKEAAHTSKEWSVPTQMGLIDEGSRTAQIASCNSLPITGIRQAARVTKRKVPCFVNFPTAYLLAVCIVATCSIGQQTSQKAHLIVSLVLDMVLGGRCFMDL
jgi:hypothetical protein